MTLQYRQGLNTLKPCCGKCLGQEMPCRQMRFVGLGYWVLRIRNQARLFFGVSVGPTPCPLPRGEGNMMFSSPVERGMSMIFPSPLGRG
jgi:hypothetical protein